MNCQTDQGKLQEVFRKWWRESKQQTKVNRSHLQGKPSQDRNWQARKEHVATSQEWGSERWPIDITDIDSKANKANL